MSELVFDAEDAQDIAQAAFLKGVAWSKRNPNHQKDDVIKASVAYRNGFLGELVAAIARAS